MRRSWSNVLRRRAKGDYIGQELSVGTQVSLLMTFGSAAVTRRARLRYAYFYANGVSEDGAGGEEVYVSTDNVHNPQTVC